MTTISDTFTRGDSATTLGSTESPVLAWTAELGTCGISSGKAYVAVPAGSGAMATIPVGVANMDVSAVISGTTNDASVVASSVDPSNHYRVDVGSTAVAVKRVIGGSETNLSGNVGSWSSGSTLRLVTNDSGSGTQVTAYIGAAQVYTTLDTTVGRPAGTRAGFRDGSLNNPGLARWDTFTVVYTEPPTPPPPPAVAQMDGVPLTVRIWGAKSERRITRTIRDLTFGTAAPGGFTNAQVSLNEPLIFAPLEFQAFGRLAIYDGRNGETAFEGRLDDPARAAGADGEVWSLTAVGGSAHTTDQTLPIIYLDRSLDGWEHSIIGGTDIKNGTAETRTGETDANILYVQIPAGTPVATADRVAFNYMRFRESVQKAALINYQWDAGGTTVNYQVRCISNSGDVLVSQNMSTSGGDPGTQVIGTDFTVGDDIFALMIYRSGAGETPGVDTNWVTFWDLRVGATRYTKSGTEITTGYTSADEMLNTSDIVADLLGRCLPQFAGADAYIETTTFDIEHLAYPDAVTPQQILDDLATFEPAYYWAVWEPKRGNVQNTKWSFEYRAWPTTARYEATVRDGFDAPASGADLFNRVQVRWRRPNGRIAVTIRTQTVPELDNAVDGPLIRTGFIDAGDNTVATITAANKVGDEFLAQHRTRGNSGRLRIARPTWDFQRNRYVEPWEIRAGAVIRVRGVLPSPDSLNATTTDAVTLFKIAATTYSQSDNAVDLELDAYTFSQSRALADLSKRIDNLRRR